MSLYQLQIFLFDINREPGVQQHYRSDRDGLLDRYEMTTEVAPVHLRAFP